MTKTVVEKRNLFDHTNKKKGRLHMDELKEILDKDEELSRKVNKTNKRMEAKYVDPTNPFVIQDRYSHGKGYGAHYLNVEGNRNEQENQRQNDVREAVELHRIGKGEDFGL